MSRFFKLFLLLKISQFLNKIVKTVSFICDILKLKQFFKYYSNIQRNYYQSKIFNHG